VTRTTRADAGGRAYLDLQNLARRQGRQTQTLMVIYVLERFLARLQVSGYADRFVLKGGMLLAAWDARRATVDADFLARNLNLDEESVLRRIVEIAALRRGEIQLSGEMLCHGSQQHVPLLIAGRRGFLAEQRRPLFDRSPPVFLEELPDVLPDPFVGGMDLWACALTRHAYISVYEQRFGDAVPLLAERVRAFTRPGNGGWLRFDGSRLAEDRASCHVQQRRPDLAEPILLELLKKHQSGRRRGIALADLAAVSAQRPDVLRLVTYGAAAIDHTRQTGSGVVLRKLQNLRPELARFKQDPHVRNLDTEIAHLVVSSH